MCVKLINMSKFKSNEGELDFNAAAAAAGVGTITFFGSSKVNGSVGDTSGNAAQGTN